MIVSVSPLTPNYPYRGRTAPLTSKRCILYIYSTNIGTEYFKHGIYSPFFLSLQNAVCFIILTFGSCIIHILYTVCAKIKKKSLRQKVNEVTHCIFSSSAVSSVYLIPLRVISNSPTPRCYNQYKYIGRSLAFRDATKENSKLLRKIG